MLGPRDRLIGQLFIDGDVRVGGGILEGEVEATGDVEIDDMAKVKASVAGRDVSIRGQLVGPVVARRRLMVGKSGSVIGDVRVGRLVIQDGASFSGKVSMGAGAEAPAAIKAPAPAVPAPPVPAPEAAAPKAPVTPAQAVPALTTPVQQDGKGGKTKTPPPRPNDKPKRR